MRFASHIPQLILSSSLNPLQTLLDFQFDVREICIIIVDFLIKGNVLNILMMYIFLCHGEVASLIPGLAIYICAIGIPFTYRSLFLVWLFIASFWFGYLLHLRNVFLSTSFLLL